MNPLFEDLWYRLHLTWKPLNRSEECSTVVRYSFQAQKSKHLNVAKGTVIVEQSEECSTVVRYSFQAQKSKHLNVAKGTVIVKQQSKLKLPVHRLMLLGGG
jgi:hypothetical protein